MWEEVDGLMLCRKGSMLGRRGWLDAVTKIINRRKWFDGRSNKKTKSFGKF